MIAPSEVFMCADNRYLAVSPGPQFWRQFCTTIGRPELADDPRFATQAGRIANVEALAVELQEVLAKRTSREWADDLFEARVPSSPVHSVSEALEQQLAKERAMVESVAHRATGQMLRFLGNPFKFQGSEPLAYPPSIGEHTRGVLTRLCGYSEQKLDELHRSNAIHTGGTRDQAK
jgi:CoA:oxalate CoA-transferase